MIRYSIFFAAFLLNVGLSVTDARANSGFNLEVFSKGKQLQGGVVTQVAPELFLTSRSLVIRGDQLVVEDSDSGAGIVGVLVAESEIFDLALIKVDGLAIDSISLAQEAAVPGRRVRLALSGGRSREGIIHSLSPAGQKDVEYTVLHTAYLESGEFGAPLLNNCGELLGLSHSRLIGIFDKKLEVASGFGVVGSLEGLKQFLTDNEVPFTESVAVCLSIEEQLEAERLKLELADKEVNDLQNQQEELEKQQEELEKQRRAEAKRKAELEKEAKQREQELAEQGQELLKRETELEETRNQKDATEKQKQELENKRREQQEKIKKSEEEMQLAQTKQLYIAGAFILIILIAVVFYRLVIRRQGRQLGEAENAVKDSTQKLVEKQALLGEVREELEKSSATFSDILIAGEDEDAEEHRVKINGNALARSPDGQVLGRSARNADYVLDVEQVSREHLRLTIVEDQLVITELGSANGTSVNGVSIASGESSVLNSGDELVIGTFVSRVHMLGNEE